MNQTIRVALPKGRLGEQVYGVFAQAGFPCPALLEEGRKLVFENPEAGVQYFWVKPTDVPVYVQRGAADLGVAGYDVLLESGADVYELLDLGLGKCRMAVAAPNGYREPDGRLLRVATKYPAIAAGYYAQQGKDIDIIQLHGSIEIAPLLDLSDVIVDIVETGVTLKENGLRVVDAFLPISARLIANKAGFRFASGRIEQITSGLRAALEAQS